MFWTAGIHCFVCPRSARTEKTRSGVARMTAVLVKDMGPSRELGPIKPTADGSFVNPPDRRRTLMPGTPHRSGRQKGRHRMLESLFLSAGSIAVGFLLLNQGAKFITDNATRISGRIGRSRFVFGALFVSTLSALPELLVSGIAAR